MKISSKNIFLILLGYQLTWLFCIFGEFYKISLAGFFAGIFYLIIFFYFNNDKINALKICLIFSLIGYLFDSILGFTKIFTINSKIMIGYLPIWFIVLWPSFTTLFVNILIFLKNRPFFAFLIGSLFAPPTYYSGILLGIASSDNLLFAITIMAIFWGSYLSFYSFYLRKSNY